MSQFFTDFSENPIQAGTPSGWTQRIKNAAGANAAIVNGGAKGNVFKLNTSTGGSFVFSYNAVNNQQDVETLTLFRVVDTSQGGRFGINYNRYEGTSEATTKGFNTNFTQASSVLSVFVVEDSTGTINFTNFTWSLNTWYYMRFRTVGTTVQAKIWAEGSAEPGTWLLSQTYTGPTIANPYSGVGHFVQNSSIEYAQFSVGTGGDSAPIMQPTLSYTANAEIIYPPVPDSTPLGMYGAGYGAPMGYGGMYGAGVIPAFTVEHQDYTANAFIDKKRTLTYASNALIVYLKNSTYTANAFIDKQNKLNSTSNAFIDWKLSLAYQANARIERIESLGYTSNADIESYYFTSSVDYISNARIEKTSTVAYSSNAFIENTRTITHAANAFIEWQKNIGYTANAFVEKQNTINYMANAFINHKTAISYEANAFVEWQLVSPYTASAFVEWVKSQVYTSHARIERAGQQIDYDSNARIERIEQLSYTASANISNPVPDKRPQTWEDNETRQPQKWSADDKTPATWNESDEKQPAEWQDSSQRQPQQWSESDNKKPADWSPIYYD